MARHLKVVVPDNPNAKPDPRKIHVPDHPVAAKPEVRGARRRSVLRDTVRHTLMKAAGIGRAPASEEVVEEPVEPILPTAEELAQTKFNRRRELADATETVETETAEAIGIEDVGVGTEPGAEGRAGDSGTPTPPAPPAPAAEPKKKLTQAERQALLADARAKKDAKKAGKGSTKSSKK
jgi:hypothetical protein